MSVYMIIETLECLDEDIYTEYKMKAKEIITSYGGKYLASSTKVRSMSGDWNPDRIVIIEFPDMKAFDDCFESDEYKKIAPLRIASVKGKSIAVEA
ncbi:MAG: DUF1330 domain-containing protein [Denitrovibrio sp.]|nr:MAG: DUF1330 domain-containing protein [Denitrovibrio sp.]